MTHLAPKWQPLLIRINISPDTYGIRIRADITSHPYGIRMAGGHAPQAFGRGWEEAVAPPTLWAELIFIENINRHIGGTAWSLPAHFRDQMIP